MGLDITAYRKVEFVRELKRGEEGDEEWPSLTSLHVNPDFPAQADGLKRGLYRVSGSFDRALAAEYGGEADPDQFKFCAGSYSGYSLWRSHLKTMVAGVTYRQTAFSEIINFSDCEGIIGPKTSAKLFKHFDSWLREAAIYSSTLREDEGESFMSVYHNFKKAFEMAAEGGCVEFH